MKGRKNLSVLVVLFLSVLMLFGGCTECTKTIYYTEKVPIYVHMDVIRDSTSIQGVRAISHVDVIKHSNSAYALMDENKGVHVVDRSNVLDPVMAGYIEVAQCKAIELKGSYLYVVQASDLLVFDLSDMANIQLTKRLKNVVHQPSVKNDSFAIDYISVEKVRTVQANTCSDNVFFAEDIAIIEPEFLRVDQADMLIVDDQLFIGHAKGMSSWATTDPANPTMNTNIELETFNHFNYLTHNNDLLFLGDASQFSLFDISSTSPSLIQQLSFGNRCSRMVFENGKLIANNASFNKTNACFRTETVSLVSMQGLNLDFRTIEEVSLPSLNYIDADNRILAASMGKQGLKLFEVRAGAFSATQHVVGTNNLTSEACDLDGDLVLSWSGENGLNLLKHELVSKRINWLKKLD